MFQRAGDRRVVWRDEGGEDSKHVAYAAPFIAFSPLDSQFLDNRPTPLRFRAEFEFVDLRFVKAFSPFDVERGGEIAYQDMGPPVAWLRGPRLPVSVRIGKRAVRCRVVDVDGWSAGRPVAQSDIDSR